MRNLLFLLLLLLPVASAGEVRADPLADLEAAVARHPEDPDLRWLFARALAERGRRERAIAELERLRATAPDRRATAPLLLGRLLAEAGRCEEAVPPLRHALALDADLASAHFELGLCLRELGRGDEADRHLVAAGRMEPALRGEALLLRALSHIDRGDRAGANALLRETIELDPGSEAAGNARLLLGERAPSAGGRRLRIAAYAGVDFDSNVTLDSGDVVGLDRNRNDGAGVWGTSASGVAFRGERSDLTLGARYDARRYFDQGEFDTHDLLAFFSARLGGGRQLVWRLDGLFSQGFLADAPYLSRTRLSPGALLLLGERAGVARLYAEGEALWFEDRPRPSFSHLERDGFRFGAGLEHYLGIPGLQRSWVAWHLRYAHRLTDASRPDRSQAPFASRGFDGDYDHDRVGGGLRAQLALPLAFDLEARLGVSGEFYSNDNLVDFITESAPRTRKRDDLVIETGLRLMRPLTRYLDLELSWRFQDRDSNVDVYAYDRHVAGVRLRVHGI